MHQINNKATHQITGARRINLNSIIASFSDKYL